MSEEVKIKLVYLRTPCSSCQIKLPYIKEILNKAVDRYEKVSWCEIKLDRKNELNNLNEIELNLLPIILINGEQVTAGTIPSENKIISTIERMLNSED